MSAIARYMGKLMQAGDLPACITYEEAKGRVFYDLKVQKRTTLGMTLEEYHIFLFKPNHCLIRKKSFYSTEEEFVKDVFSEFRTWHWKEFAKLFIQDEKKLKKCEKIIADMNEKELENNEYHYYLILRERFETKEITDKTTK